MRACGSLEARVGVERLGSGGLNTAQVVDSTKQQNGERPQKRRSEVHGGYTVGLRNSRTRTDVARVKNCDPLRLCSPERLNGPLEQLVHGADAEFIRVKLFQLRVLFATWVFSGRCWEFGQECKTLLIAWGLRSSHRSQRSSRAYRHGNQERALGGAQRRVSVCKGAVVRQRFAMAGRIRQSRRRSEWRFDDKARRPTAGRGKCRGCPCRVRG